MDYSAIYSYPPDIFLKYFARPKLRVNIEPATMSAEEIAAKFKS